MTQTIPATYINTPETGYCYMTLMSENAQAKISRLLSSLNQELPEVLWTMPPSALHITLCEIVQSRKAYKQDKDALFDSRKAEYVEGAAEALSSVHKFSVLFNEIEVSPEAIIIKAQDGAVFNGIRTRLLGHITLPEETRRPPDITHTSIARFTQAVDVEAVRTVVAKHEFSLLEPVTEFKLLKTIVPPALQYEEIARYQLAG